MFKLEAPHLTMAALFTLVVSAASGLGTSPARADAQSCMNGVGDFIKRAGLEVSSTEFRSALVICERTGGNLKLAISALPTGSQASQPKIVSFRIDPPRVRPGEFVSFFWRVEDATQVTLSDNVGVLEESDDLIANGTSSIGLNETTTFRLVAENRKGQSITDTFTVQVMSAPRPSDGCENLPPNQQDKCGG